MISTARNYAQTIFGRTKFGLDRSVTAHKIWFLDRSVTAHKIWECCVIPSILYATEAMLISKQTVLELNKIQHSVVVLYWKFFLLPHQDN